MEAGALALRDFSFLDLIEFRSKYASGPEQNKIRFYINGIHCGKCVRKLESLPLVVPGLRRIEVELGTHLATIEIDPAKLNFSTVAQKIMELGFEPVPVRRDQDADLIEKQEDRQELIRLGVGAACAGNIMTFAFATYVGAAGNWSELFEWLSLVLYLPVLSYVAVPFYRGAWRSLKQKQISIDLPMAVASLSGFLFSTIELLRGRSDIYFDSLSGFLFLILLSRYAQKRLQRSFLRTRELSEGLQMQKVRRINAHGWNWQPLERLLPGDSILVHAPEILPGEAELLSRKAYFSLAWLSGEAKPKSFLRGSLVPAGSRLVTGEAQLRIVRRLDETTFGRILAEVQKFSLARNRIVTRADLWAQWLLGVVFVIAIAFLAFYWVVSPEEAIRRSLALIILACPCAMAFGTPLALAAFLRRARKSGLVIRDANVFERATEVKTVFFDKTGTLTDSDLSLVNPASSIPTVYQKIILALENESFHPIAFSFRRAFPSPEQLPAVEGFKELPGVGVSGFVFGRQYEIKRDGVGSTELSCALFEDDQQILSFTFQARIKPDSGEVLQALRQRGYDVRLLSGDGRESVESMAKFLGFNESQIYFGLTPEDKARIVAQFPKSMMVGDGINDSLALMRTHVSVAVSGGVEVALKSAQVYLGEQSLKGIVDLLDLSQRTLATIRQNLILALIYNALGGALALLGFVNPLVAALLMPISSAFVLTSTWLRGRL